MAIAVNNTALDLAGKTLTKLEDPQTIVGLKTFNLALAAPFAVAAGAAMVSNLDAEKVGGETKAQLHDATLLTGLIPPARLPTAVTLVDGGTVSIDAALGTTFALSAGDNRTLAAPTNPSNAQKIIIAHHANGADRTLTLTGGTGGFRFGTDIPALTPTLNGKVDYIGCIYNGFVSGTVWDVVAYSKGY